MGILIQLQENAILRRHRNQPIPAGAYCIGEQCPHALHIQQKWNLFALQRMESTSQNPQSTARSQAHVWSPLLPQIINCKDGSYQVLDIIPLWLNIKRNNQNWCFWLVFLCGFPLFIPIIKWLFFPFEIFVIFAVLTKGILGCHSYLGKGVLFTVSEPIPINWVSWRVHLGLRLVEMISNIFCVHWLFVLKFWKKSWSWKLWSP